MRNILSLCLFLHAIVTFGEEKTVNVNGRNYRVFVKGLENRKQNTPVVIFENGMGVDLGNWYKITEQISSFAPVFAYDRAGIGKSDKVFTLPSPKFVAENLHDILKTLKITPPYILVGHSLGGVYVRSFAGFYANEISGLVFIDPADFTETKNDWNAIFRTMGVPEKKIDEMLYSRLYQQRPPVDSLHYGPWSEGQVLNSLRRTDFSEISDLPLPDVPVIFFVGGKFTVPPDQRSRDFDQEVFFHLKNTSNMERWKKLIYSSKRGGTLIFLANAGHYIHWDDPKAVIANIKILYGSLTE